MPEHAGALCEGGAGGHHVVEDCRVCGQRDAGAQNEGVARVAVASAGDLHRTPGREGDGAQHGMAGVPAIGRRYRLGEIRRQLGYKAVWRGRVVSVVDRFDPSSRTCSACGHVHGGLRRNDCRWNGPACGAAHDRDYNAAITIEREGLRRLAEIPGGAGELTRGESMRARQAVHRLPDSRARRTANPTVGRLRRPCSARAGMDRRTLGAVEIPNRRLRRPCRTTRR